MPYSVDISLKVVHRLPEEAGEEHLALKAFFYRCIETVEPRLAHFIHTRADPKPFTVSPLAAQDAGRYHFRLTLLEDEYLPYFAAGMKREPTLRVGKEILRAEDEPRVEARGYAEFAESAEAAREVRLQFETPTAFRSHDMDDLLPLPRRVFQSYLRRWNAFSGLLVEPPERFLEWVEENVAVSRLDLETQVLKFKEHVQIGCTGAVQYDLPRLTARDAEMVRALNRLADYAYYCGTGHKTTEGMGQTRRLGKWPEA